MSPVTTKENGNGAGLGLPTCRTIVEDIGGRIDVESEPGEGSVFHVYVPTLVTSARQGTSVKPQALGDDAGSETILVIEDEDVVRKMVNRLLSLRGYRVLEAATGEEALAVATADREPIHLVLSDVVLPGLSGPETVSRLQQQAVCAKTVYMSGYGYEELLRRHAVPPGAHCIQKPFQGDVLARKIREVLDV